MTQDGGIVEITVDQLVASFATGEQVIRDLEEFNKTKPSVRECAQIMAAALIHEMGWAWSDSERKD